MRVRDRRRAQGSNLDWDMSASHSATPINPARRIFHLSLVASRTISLTISTIWIVISIFKRSLHFRTEWCNFNRMQVRLRANRTYDKTLRSTPHCASGIYKEGYNDNGWQLFFSAILVAACFLRRQLLYLYITCTVPLLLQVLLLLISIISIQVPLLLLFVVVGRSRKIYNYQVPGRCLLCTNLQVQNIGSCQEG